MNVSLLRFNILSYNILAVILYEVNKLEQTIVVIPGVVRTRDFTDKRDLQGMTISYSSSIFGEQFISRHTRHTARCRLYRNIFHTIALASTGTMQRHSIHLRDINLSTYYKPFVLLAVRRREGDVQDPHNLMTDTYLLPYVIET